MNTDPVQTHSRGVFFALALIVAGALLFLDNLGVLPIENIGAYWPLALVVYGLGLIYRSRTRPALVWAATMIVGGFLLVLGNLGILRLTFGGLWPLILIAIGAIMLLDRSRWANLNWPEFQGRSHRRWRRRAFATSDYAVRSDFMRRHFTERNLPNDAARADPASEPPGNRLDAVAIFFSMKRRVEDPDFQGGELVAVFGSIELDLSSAAIQTPDRTVILDASAVFGAIEITVPRTWRIIREGAGVFGSYEDKTLPGRPEPGAEAPRLVLRGGAVFGSVTVSN
jgi:hypothetical protein